MPRVLLVETWHDDAHRHHRAEFFPFLLAFARDQGWHAQWWVLAVPPDFMHVGTRYVVDLPPDQRDAFGAQVAALHPDTLVFHDRPAPEWLHDLHLLVPDVRIADLTAVPRLQVGPAQPPVAPIDPEETLASIWRLLTGTEAPPQLEGALLLDLPHPAFDRRYLDANSPSALQRPLRLAQAAECIYRRPVHANPVYRSLDSENVRRHLGCAFCPQSHPRPSRLQTPPVELALRQIEASQRAAPQGQERFAYLFEDSPLSGELAGLFAAVLDRGIKPSIFYTMIRVDVLLGLLALLEDALPRLQTAGHGLRILSIGAENFSGPENERFNKGISTAQIWKCFERIRDIEARFPETFACPDHGYFSAILFTPWTTPEDLRANIEASRRLGASWLNRSVGTRLQLWPEVPITDLARRDRLLVDRRDPAVQDITAVCASSPDQKELPWRFADARTARIHAILIRLEPLPVQATFARDDAQYLEIARLRALLPAEFAKDYITLVDGVVGAVLELGADASLQTVFCHAFGAQMADQAAQRGELHVAVVDCGADDAEYHFVVAHHQEDQPFFRRVGALTLSYTHARMTPAADAFCRMLQVAMKTLPSSQLRAADVAQWQVTVRELLRRSGAGARFRWSIVWAP